MVERVALAIRATTGNDILSEIGAAVVAYAAIEAMREPAKAMIQAADEPNAAATFRAMIDEALK